jgi:DNA-binding NtrC family response regulator
LAYDTGLRAELRSNLPNPWIRRINVLMVDANPSDQRLMNEALTMIAGCQFAGVRNAAEALRYLELGGPVDLVVLTLDCEMNGLELLRFVNQSHYTRSRVPVAVFAGGSGPNEANLVRSLGASSYMHKPYDFDGLLRVASELLEFADPAPDGKPESSAPSNRVH